jgi:hypothetical protein
MKMIKTKSFLNALLLVPVALLLGCSKPETLEESVNSRWQAIVNNDLETAYEYFSPGYKEVESLDGYKYRLATAKINMQWTAGKFLKADCENENVCNVSVEIVYNYSFPKRTMGKMEGIKTTSKESWLKVEDQWFFIPEKKL